MQRRFLTRAEIKTDEEYLCQQASIINRFHPPQLSVKGDIVRSRVEPHKVRVFEVVHIKGPILHLRYRTGTPLPIITHAWQDLYHYKPETVEIYNFYPRYDKIMMYTYVIAYPYVS